MTNNKILDLNDLLVLITDLKKNGKKVGLSHGVFDLVHPGHIQHFIAAKNLVDILIVSVTEDKYVNKGPGRPVFNQKIRLQTLAALEPINYVVLSENPTAEQLIDKIKPNLYFKGSDYKIPTDDPTGKINNERELVEANGGTVHFTNEMTSSSSKLLNQYFNNLPTLTQSWLNEIKNTFTFEEITTYLDQLLDLEIVLTGEVIIDQYTKINPLAKSSKDPILAFQRGKTETFAGGILAVANNCAAWVKKVKVISFSGQHDQHISKLAADLHKNIELDLLRLVDRPTILKHRFVDENSNVRIFEYYDFEDTFINGVVEKKLIKSFEKINPESLILVADYGHGLMTELLISYLANKENYLAVNAQANAGNRGFNTISKFKRADFFTLNSGELRLELREKSVDYFEVVPLLMKKLAAQNAIITLGGDGLISFSQQQSCKSPALGTRIIDKVGAGDSVFAMGSLLSYLKAPLVIVGLICNIVASHEISQLGHRSSLQIGDIKKQVKSLLS